jgi:hypothetical protein
MSVIVSSACPTCPRMISSSTRHFRSHEILNLLAAWGAASGTCWAILAAEAVNDHEHSARAEGIPEVMAEAMRCHNQPLTKQMLCDWHYRLFFYDATRICVSVRSVHLDEVWVGVEDDPMWTLTRVPTWGINGHFGAGSS